MLVLNDPQLDKKGFELAFVLEFRLPVPELKAIKASENEDKNKSSIELRLPKSLLKVNNKRSV